MHIDFFKIPKWFNYYNFFCYGFIAILLTGLPYTFFHLLIQLGYTHHLIMLSYQVINNILTLLALTLGFSILIPFFQSKKELDFFKSIHNTRKARRFLRFESGSKKDSDHITSATEAQKNLANAAIRTLVVNYYYNKATVSIKLPENYDAQKLLLEKFPALKDKLNARNNGFLFNDLTPEDDRIYSATARKKH